MTTKNLAIATSVLNITGGALLVGSFFMKDNNKAVNYRWAALGAFTLAWGVRVYKVAKS